MTGVILRAIYDSAIIHNKLSISGGSILSLWLKFSKIPGPQKDMASWGVAWQDAAVVALFSLEKQVPLK